MEKDNFVTGFTETVSDSIRKHAHAIAMEKAMLCSTNKDITPEDFDEAFVKELAKEWDKVKDKSAPQLAVMGLLEIMAYGDDERVEEILDRIGGTK